MLFFSVYACLLCWTVPSVTGQVAAAVDQNHDNSNKDTNPEAADSNYQQAFLWKLLLSFLLLATIHLLTTSLKLVVNIVSPITTLNYAKTKAKRQAFIANAIKLLSIIT